MIRLIDVLQEVHTQQQLIKEVEARLGRRLTEAEIQEIDWKKVGQQVKDVTRKTVLPLALTGALTGSPDTAAKGQAVNQPTAITQTVSQQLTAADKKDWNAFVEWLKSEGESNNTDMNSDAHRAQVIKDYLKVNPKSKITLAKDDPFVKKVQAYMIDYRNKLIEKDKLNAKNDSEGVTLAGGKYRGTDYSTFMPAIKAMDDTGTDGKVGQFTSQWTFKDYLLKDPTTGKLQKIGDAPDL